MLMVPNAWLQLSYPPNVWIGTSCEDQQRANERIPHLLRVPARRRFLSCEPLLGPLDLSAYLATCEWCGGSLYGDHECYDPAGIDWVIVGGESGHGARPMHPDWARGLRDQCVAAGVAFFFKQWGEYGPVPQGPDGRILSSHKVSLFAGYGTGRTVEIAKLGKHAAGRLLDGVEWNQFPDEVPA